MSENSFKVIVPASFEKSGDSWRVKGIASTSRLDRQGETIIQKGIDLSPIDRKRGILNWDHMSGPENIIGTLDGYMHTDNGLIVEGRLFKNHSKAKAIQEIMASLEEGDHGRMGMSVEGQILERDPSNPKIIKKCRINAVALTMNPVNEDTYVSLAKSLNGATLEFDSTGDEQENIEKALTVSGDKAVLPPTELSGGDALAKEELCNCKNCPDCTKKPKKKLKKMCKDLYKSNMLDILEKLQVLYPGFSRNELWTALKDRLERRFDVN